MRQAGALLLFFLLQTAEVFAQNTGLGSWSIFNTRYTLSDKWSVFGEAQLRSLKFYDNFFYYEYKGGVSYRFHKNVSFLLGSGSYQTYQEGGDFIVPKNNDEFRAWLQGIATHGAGKFRIEHRVRTEFRFTSGGYRNRFRYRAAALYLLGKARNGYNAYQLVASSEFFFSDNNPVFERERILVAFNYKPSSATTLQLGYLHQSDYKIDETLRRDFLQVGFFLELARKQLPRTTPAIQIQDD